MTEPVSSSSSSSPGMTIDIRPMIEDVSQVMTKHITKILSGVIGEYTIYKETHDTIMGLPCVRKLQERIEDLEGGGHAAPVAAASPNSREDEITQLQSAIVELNRYIIALETKVDMKSVCPSKDIEVEKDDEESVRLEIHEDDDNHVDNNDTVDAFTVSSRHKNAIISNTDTTADDAEEEGDDAVEDFEEGAATDDTAEEEVAATEDDVVEAAEEEEEAAEEDEEAAEDDVVEAEEEAEEEAAEDDVVEAEEEEEEEEAAEDDVVEEEVAATEEEEEAAEEEDDVVEAAEEEAAEEEAEIEVSEVKIKGKTYFTTDTQNGIIYACVDDDVGDEVGVFKNGVAVFNKGKK